MAELGAGTRDKFLIYKSRASWFSAFPELGGELGSLRFSKAKKIVSSSSPGARKLLLKKAAYGEFRNYMPIINRIAPTYIDYENPFYSRVELKVPVLLQKKYNRSLKSLVTSNSNALGMLLKLPFKRLIFVTAYVANRLHSVPEN